MLFLEGNAGVWNSVPAVAAIGAVFGAVYGVFTFVDEVAAPQLKKKISDRLNSETTFPFADELREFHATLFGRRQFSVRCVFSVLMCTLLSSVIMLIFDSAINPSFFSRHWQDVVFTVPRGIVFCILPTDFIGVWLTRGVLNSKALYKGVPCHIFIIFICDTLLKVTFVWISIFIFSSVMFSTFYPPALITIVEGTFCFREAVWFFPCEFFLLPTLAIVLSSIWVWLFAISTTLLSSMRELFDVVGKPIRSIGVVGASVCSAVYGIVLLLSYLAKE